MENNIKMLRQNTRSISIKNQQFHLVYIESCSYQETEHCL